MIMMFEIAVCDDEPVMREELFGYFTEYMDQRPDKAYRISSFESGESLLKSGREFDLIFPGHFLRPIGKRYLFDLMECAREILSGRAEPEPGDFGHMSSEPALVHRYGLASIVYNEKHIRK